MFLFLGTNKLKEPHSTSKDILNFLQIGMTNPSSKIQTHRLRSHIPSVAFSNDGQLTNQSLPSMRQSHNSSKALPSVVHTPSSLSKHNKTVQNIIKAVPVTPAQSSPISWIENQGLSIVCFLPIFDKGIRIELY